MHRRTINFLFNLGEDIKEKNYSIGFLLDLSGSMQGEPLEQVKIAINNLLRPLVAGNDRFQAADQVSIVTFHTYVQRICPWVDKEDFDFFREFLFGISGIADTFMQGAGTTALFDGMAEMLNSCYEEAKSENERIILIFSDGEAWGDQKNTEKDIQDIINHNADKPVRICSLYYGNYGQDTEGKKTLQRFADLTNGIVFDAPTPLSIPGVMQGLFHKLESKEQHGIRSGLISRLNEAAVEGNSDWFKIFSVNNKGVNAKTNSIENPNGHIIFNLNTDECCNREQVLSAFKGYDQVEDFRSLLIDSFRNQNRNCNEYIQTNPLIFITFRGNDLAGTSLSQYLYNLLDTIRGDANDILGTRNTEYHVFFMILLDRLADYTDDDKKNLAAFLNEISYFDPDFNKIHGIYLISERNDHTAANPEGYKTLSNYNFEQSVIENLFNLNVNQQLAIDSYQLAHNAWQSDSGTYNRFLSLGNVSLFADPEEFAHKVSGKLCHDLLLNLYLHDFRTDAEAVRNEVNQFMSDLSFSSLAKQVLHNDEGPDLLSNIDCPSIMNDDFIRSWKEIGLKYIDQAHPGEKFFEKLITNRNYIEYIQYLYFDVRNYVESCHAPGSFNSKILERITTLLKLKIVQLRGTTDRMLYSNDERLSSPKQAELWIDTLYKEIDSYITSNLSLDVSKYQDVLVGDYKNFDDNPQIPLDLLKKKLESYPLPLSTRMKFYSLSALITSGIISFIIAGVIPLSALLFMIIPAIIIIWGEYRIGQNKKQIRELIKWYGTAHRHRSRLQAYRFLSEQLKTMLSDLKNKIRKDNQQQEVDQIYTNDLTEQEYLDLFKNAMTISFPRYFEVESSTTQGLSPFHIDLTKGYYNNSNHHIEIIDEASIIQLSGIERISWNEFYANLIARRGKVSKRNFPTIKITFLPPDFKEHLESVSAKPGINLVSKLHLTEVIPEKLYYLTMLDNLSDQERAELKNLYVNKIWHNHIDTLVNLNTDLITLDDINFFSLWREVSFYQAWLNQAAPKNSSNIFHLWKRMYHARREFRENLIANAIDILQYNVRDSMNLWDIIIRSANKNKIVDHIKAWSFSSVYLTNTHNTYSEYSQLKYLSEDKYLSSNLETLFRQNLQSLLQDTRQWNESFARRGNSILFNHIVAVPVQDNSLLKNLGVILNTQDFLNNKQGAWTEYFLADFYNTHLKTKKQRKEFKWLFQ